MIFPRFSTRLCYVDLFHTLDISSQHSLFFSFLSAVFFFGESCLEALKNRVKESGRAERGGRRPRRVRERWEMKNWKAHHRELADSWSKTVDSTHSNSGLTFFFSLLNNFHVYLHIRTAPPFRVIIPCENHSSGDSDFWWATTFALSSVCETHDNWKPQSN